MFRKIREYINISAAKSPRKAVLVSIMLFNVIFIMIASAIIAVLSKHVDGLADCTFWVAVYRTTTMILDAGCVESVITDVGKAGAFVALLCIAVIIMGMVFFTGAVVGYITNLISDYIDSKNNGKFKLLISNHIVIINWNSRAVEIINNYLYEQKKIKVVVFVPNYRDEINEEISDRLEMTLQKNPAFKDCITYIVREGDVAAATDLDDICISEAKSVIILDDSVAERTQLIKTLMQVKEISKANKHQKILVEVGDEWTEDIVNRIIEYNDDDSNETIVPVKYNDLLGLAYSQIAMRPREDEELKARSILIFGHNSKIDSLIVGLGEYSDIVSVVVFDEEEHLAKHNYYKDYPYVSVIDSDMYDDETIYQKTRDIPLKSSSVATVLILSDDEAPSEAIDAEALVYLIYIRENIKRRMREDPSFSRENVDIVIELLNPKNEDIVRKYGVDKVIISNRYVSRLMSMMSLSDDWKEYYGTQSN